MAAECLSFYPAVLVNSKLDYSVICLSLCNFKVPATISVTQIKRVRISRRSSENLNSMFKFFFVGVEIRVTFSQTDFSRHFVLLKVYHRNSPLAKYHFESFPQLRNTGEVNQRVGCCMNKAYRDKNTHYCEKPFVFRTVGAINVVE